MNINSQVKVKLTPFGKARWKGLRNENKDELILNLWELMSCFGPGMHMGMTEMYFENNEIEIVDEI